MPFVPLAQILRNTPWRLVVAGGSIGADWFYADQRLTSVPPCGTVGL